jgi:AraC-like DNA-binding protein
MIYLPPDLPHSFSASKSGSGERLIVILSSQFWKRNQGGKFAPAVCSVSQLSKELLFHLLLHPKSKSAKPLLETFVQTTCEMLESGALNPEKDLRLLAGKVQDPRIQKALALLEKGYAQSLSMESLAKSAGLSVRNLNRLFLTELGTTPKQIVLLLRAQRAKQLLRNSQSTVTDIAFEVGYQSVSQFITSFRRLTGQLPSAYRQSKL